MDDSPVMTNGSPSPEENEPLALVVAFDFATKQAPAIPISQARQAMKEDKFVWIDVNLTRTEEARALLAELALCAPGILDDALARDPVTQIGRHDDYLHLVLAGCRLHGESFDLERVDACMGAHFLLTLHRGEPVFLKAARSEYHADFVRFARSPAFLLFELWDHLVDNYLNVQKALEERLEKIQCALTGDVDERIFKEATELGSDLMRLRKVALPARSVLTELSTRKSPFINSTSQPFLAGMVGMVESVLQDVLVDRDVLSDSLHNYMSMVAHRTNKVMRKLTVVSVIFLPLTFLCGVYGMNFEVMPELKSEWGYLGFWVVALTLAFALLVLMRRIKLL